MEAQIKCSNCGSEISNLNMSWRNKQWLWFLPAFLLIMLMPFWNDLIFKDKSDFRPDLALINVEKNYVNGTIEIFGVIENHGDVNWENIVVEAEFFQKDGKFLDEITRRLSANILPGASENFKISSKDFPKLRWEAISDMKVKVSDAFHSKY